MQNPKNLSKNASNLRLLAFGAILVSCQLGIIYGALFKEINGLRHGFMTVVITNFQYSSYWPLLLPSVFIAAYIASWLMWRIESKKPPLAPVCFFTIILGFMPAYFLPKIAQDVEEYWTFSEPSSFEIRNIHLDQVFIARSKHGQGYQAIINPHHLQDKNPAIPIKKDAYDAIASTAKAYCVPLMVQRVGTDERVIVKSAIRAVDLQICRPTERQRDPGSGPG